MFIRSLSLGLAVTTLVAGGAQAADLATDLIIPTTPQPIYEPAGFDWEGLYAGVRLGGQFVGNTAGQDYAGQVNDTLYGVAGAAVGVNFIPVDPVLIGVEITGDYLWGDNVTASSEFLANLRAGAVVTDAALVYAIGGAGVANTNNSSTGIYQLGGGLEVAVGDAISMRGEVVGQGDFTATGTEDPFFETAKATLGAFYHF